MITAAEKLVIYILYGVFLLTAFFVFVENIVSPWQELFLAGVLFISFTIKYLFYYELEQKVKLESLWLLGELFLVFFLGLTSQGAVHQLFYFVLIAYGIFNFSVGISFSFAVISYLFYLLESYAVSGVKTGFFSQAVSSFLLFLFVAGVVYLIRYFVEQNKIIDRTTTQLRIKTLEQEVTYNKLAAAYEDLEEMTRIKERNRLARQIHDNTGHILTNVLIELEAGKKLARHNLDQALQKFNLAREQVKKGLNKIRQSVSRLQQDERSQMEFIPLLKSVIEETERHTGVVVKTNIESLPDLTSLQEKTLYRALQEGLTNGLKHGNSTVFRVNLSHERGTVIFTLEDNGAGCEAVKLGFGLQSMRERVKEQGGSLTIESEPEEGFRLKIVLPV